MEHRTAKVNISTAGGTAAKNSRTCKVTLPTTWLEEMGITEEQRELELTFDGTTITLSRLHSGPDFAEQRRVLGHEVRVLRFYDGDTLCSTIYADFTEEAVVLENQAVTPIKTAFGNNLFPDWKGTSGIF